MDLDLEVLKEIYIKEVENLKNLPFYKYLHKERMRDIKREIFKSVESNGEEKVFKEVEAYLKGNILEGIRNKLGDHIGEDIIDLTGEIRKTERDKDNKLIEKEHQKIKGQEYHPAINYLCHILIIGKIEEKILAKGLVPVVDIDGKIVFKIRKP